MSTKPRKKKHKKSARPQSARTGFVPRGDAPATSTPPKSPWWKMPGLFLVWFAVMTGYMGLALTLAGGVSDPILRQAFLALPAVVSTVLRPVPMGGQFIRWLALWMLFWVSIPVASAAVFAVGGAWILLWAWNQNRDLDAVTPANALIAWVKRAVARAKGKVRRDSGA